MICMCSLLTSAPLSKLDRINVSYLTGMKMVAGHTPYVRLVFGFLFASLAFQVSSFSELFDSHTVLETRNGFD